jgi:hypothetical protein
MRSFDVGFRTRDVIGMRISDKSQAKALSWLASDPAVEAVAAAASTPLNGILPGMSVYAAAQSKGLRAWHNHVTPRFFTLLDIPILEGRNFTEEEAKAGAQVSIISKTEARSLWTKGNDIRH